MSYFQVANLEHLTLVVQLRGESSESETLGWIAKSIFNKNNFVIKGNFEEPLKVPPITINPH